MSLERGDQGTTVEESASGRAGESAPPQDDPGAPGSPSRLESKRAGGLQPAERDDSVETREKKGAGREPATGAQPEASSNGDKPGSPGLTSRLDSHQAARAEFQPRRADQRSEVPGQGGTPRADAMFAEKRDRARDALRALRNTPADAIKCANGCLAPARDARAGAPPADQPSVARDSRHGRAVVGLMGVGAGVYEVGRVIRDREE